MANLAAWLELHLKSLNGSGTTFTKAQETVNGVSNTVEERKTVNIQSESSVKVVSIHNDILATGVSAGYVITSATFSFNSAYPSTAVIQVDDSGFLSATTSNSSEQVVITTSALLKGASFKIQSMRIKPQGSGSITINMANLATSKEYTLGYTLGSGAQKTVKATSSSSGTASFIIATSSEFELTLNSLQ